jgi:CBS domain-containing protein
MLVANVVRAKGSDVVTMHADGSVRELLHVLAHHGIGAVVVTARGSVIAGIVSERDVVRALNRQGESLLDQPVASIMTSEVVTCELPDPIDDVMAVMTEHRIRHVPVVDGGALVGIVSIGDMVKRRIAELEGERNDLVTYIGTR